MKDMNKVMIFYTRLFIVLFSVLTPIIYIFIRFRKTNKNNILVIPQLKRIGDVVCSTPVFRAIKNKYPNCRLTVLTSVMAVGIMKNNPRIDKIIIIEDYQNNFFGLIKKIIDGHFGYGVSLSGSALSSVLFFGGLITNRIKITRPNSPVAEIFSDWMCNFKENYEQLSYLPLFYIKMLRHMGIENQDDKKEVFLDKLSIEKIEEFLKKNGLNSEDKLVGMSLTAGNRVKEWGDQKFEALALEINKKYGMKVIFVGSIHDKTRVDDLLNKMHDNNNFINAVGLSLEELSALMSKLFVFIAVDTGPIHIAHALNIPLIDILGPVNDIELTPHGNNIKIIKPNPEVPSTIFAFQESGPATLTRQALENINVPQVLSAFEEIVSKNN